MPNDLSHLRISDKQTREQTVSTDVKSLTLNYRPQVTNNGGGRKKRWAGDDGRTVMVGLSALWLQ